MKAASSPKRRIFRGLLKGLGGLLTLPLLYVLAAWIGSLIHLNELPQGQLPLQLVTNGVHVDVVLPLESEAGNWRKFLDNADWIDPDDRYLAIGWGERNFYLHTATWDDLSLGTALSATLLPTPTALHLTPLRGKLRASERVRSLSISPEQHQQLVREIQTYFTSSPDGLPKLIPGESYTGRDRFYEANGSYHLFMTCNEWINQRLRHADVPAVAWAAFDWGLLG
jgi:uncharacterized protein (TIGR02117 family)